MARDSIIHHKQRYHHARSTQELDIIQVKRLVLVNTDTGRDVMDITNGTEYDVAVVGANLTIRAETTDKNGCGWVVFNLDEGLLQHTDLNRPFSLAGNGTDGKLYPSATLSQIGAHTIRVTPSVDGSLLEVPAELDEFPIEERRKNFKSCWSLQFFKGVTADGEPVVPENTTTPGFVGETLAPFPTPIAEKANSFTSVLADFVTEKAASLSSLLLSSRGGRYLKDGGELRERREEVSEFLTLEDGSAYVTFYVSNGPRTIAPTPAPKPSYDVAGYSATAAGTMQGDFKVWNKLTLAFVGPSTSELGSSERGPYGPLVTFKDFRVDVTFQHFGTGSTFVVPGYFALDGDSANSIGKTQDGSVWMAHFVPNFPGDWTWSVSFREGENCAPNGGGESAGYFDGLTGTFFVDIADPGEEMDAKDLRRKGKLQYIGRSQLQFAGSEEYYLKVGPESPENFLAYTGFDGVLRNSNFGKTYSAHIADYVDGNPTWSGGNGVAIIGALNYLSSTGVNTISVTALTYDGPDGNVHPFIDPTLSKVNFDVSKLAQWQVVFDWAERKGITIRFTFTDSDSDDMLDGGLTMEERKTFYREMIARFGHHLGLIWDLGEDIANVDEIKARSGYIRSIDPYSSPILVQTAPDVQSSVYKQLYGVSTIEMISTSSKSVTDVAATTSEFIATSAAIGRPLVVSTDSIESSTSLWANIVSGGVGGQMYFGATDDLSLQDFKTKSAMLTEAGYALSFFSSNKIPFQDMTPIFDTGYTSLSSSSIVVTYKFPGVATLLVDLLGSPSYSVTWYDPSTGTSSAGATVTGGTDVNIGSPPSSPEAAWVCLLKAV
jgi:Domain of unknown function (DUF5060)